jgi:DNA repair exonuclease SbcCD ATPase subunit
MTSHSSDIGRRENAESSSDNHGTVLHRSLYGYNSSSNRESSSLNEKKLFESLDALDYNDTSRHASMLKLPDAHTSEQPLAERVTAANDRAVMLYKEIDLLHRHIWRIEREERLIQQPFHNFVRSDIQSLLTRFDRMPADSKNSQNAYQDLKSELDKDDSYHQKRLSDVVQRRESLQQEKQRLEARIAELRTQEQAAWNDYDDLQRQASYSPELSGELTQTRLTYVLARVEMQEERLHKAIKTHEALLEKLQSRTEKMPSEESELIALRQQSEHAKGAVQKITSDLQKTTSELQYLREKARDTPLSAASWYETTTPLMKATRNRYEAQRYHDSFVQQSAEFELKQEASKEILPPLINEQDHYMQKWSELHLYREKLNKKVEVFVSVEQFYYEAHKELERHGLNCCYSKDKLKTARDALNSIPGPLQVTREKMKTLYDALDETHCLVEKQYQLAKERREQAWEQLKTLEQKDLAEVNKKIAELERNFSDDHSYFPWYERSEYNAEAEARRSLTSSNPRGGCVVAAAMSRMSDYPTSKEFDMHSLVEEQVVKAVKLKDTGEARLKDLPAAFEELKVPEPYSMVNLQGNHAFAALERLVQQSPAIVCLRNKAHDAHVVVVDKIEKDQQTGIQYVCIRDQIGGLDEKGASYKVRSHTFQDVWDSSEVVVPAKTVDREQRV